MMLARGSMTRPIIERIVSVYSITNSFKFALDGQLIQHAEKFVLAEEAAVHGIRAVGGIVHFLGLHEFMAHPQLAHKFFDHRPVISGETWRKCGYRQSSFAQG